MRLLPLPRVRCWATAQPLHRLSVAELPLVLLLTREVSLLRTSPMVAMAVHLLNTHLRVLPTARLLRSTRPPVLLTVRLLPSTRQRALPTVQLHRSTLLPAQRTHQRRLRTVLLRRSILPQARLTARHRLRTLPHRLSIPRLVQHTRLLLPNTPLQVQPTAPLRLSIRRRLPLTLLHLPLTLLHLRSILPRALRTALLRRSILPQVLRIVQRLPSTLQRVLLTVRLQILKTRKIRNVGAGALFANATSTLKKETYSYIVYLDLLEQHVLFSSSIEYLNRALVAVGHVLVPTRNGCLGIRDSAGGSEVIFDTWRWQLSDHVEGE